MNIATSIKDLLYLHDCVIIPNFGGFLLNYKPASIHPVTNLFTPPAKTLAFNRNLIVNDGLLANHIARKHHITYNEALTAINSQVRQMRHDLEHGKPVIVGDAGTFTLDRQGNLQFTPDESINYFGDSFGLGSFTSPAIIRNATPVKHEEPARISIAPEAQQPSLYSRLRRVAAILIPAAIISGAVLVSFLNTDRSIDDKISYSGILVSCNRTPTNETPVSVTPVEESSIENITPPDTTVHVGAQEVPTATTPTNQPPQKQYNNPSRQFVSRFKAPQTPEKRYYIIIGSFNTLESAERKVEQLRTTYYEDSYIVNTSKQGTYRVSAVSYFGFDKAKMQLSTIKQQLNKDAWILHM